MLSRLTSSAKSGLDKIFRPSVTFSIAMAIAGAFFVHLLSITAPTPFGSPLHASTNQVVKERPPAIDFPPNHEWLNTDKPLNLKELKGRVVLLDFWTLCCINCIHIMPDLARLEARYPGVLVVIGVHSPKFENEKKTESIRKAILRYEIKHPVINDVDHKVWKSYGVQSWPTMVLIDPDGKFVGHVAGEGNFDTLDATIGKLIKEFKGKGLKETPFDIKLIQEKVTSPLFFPGKVVADAASGRVFIADSTNHRIVITSLEGKKIAVAGAGKEGFKDGKFDEARFSDPQGLTLDGDILYVADRKNHSIRALDLKDETVKTVAGTGEQEHNWGAHKSGIALATRMNSPWDVLQVNKKIYIAMAGHHQIWIFDPAKKRVGPYAGKGDENIRDGTLQLAAFAQPSGLTTDGKHLYVADSEVSAIRSVPLPGVKGNVTTIVGEGLFEFGDKNGQGNAVRLQHALGVAYFEGKLYVADTYNSKIKIIDPAARTCDTFLGDPPGWLKEKMFFEPGGVSISGGKMYVADTNNHRIQVVDMKTKEMATLRLQGVEPVSREAVASKETK
jgi:DNA-binding beta-propeller fold protein YncE